MTNDNFMNIPSTCMVGSIISKKLFYEKVELSKSDKALFADAVDKMLCLYCLKPDTINIKSYKDALRAYSEIEIIEVQISKDTKVKRIAEIIMRAIPYPMLLIFKLGDKTQLYVAHQRINQNDSTKNTIEEIIATDWLEDNSILFEKLDIKQMRYTNFYELYSDIVDVISIYNLSVIMPIDDSFTGETARQISAEIDTLEQEITLFTAKLKNETQFNRKMEYNIKIKKLEEEKLKIIGGSSKC